VRAGSTGSIPPRREQSKSLCGICSESRVTRPNGRSLKRNRFHGAGVHSALCIGSDRGAVVFFPATYTIRGDRSAPTNAPALTDRLLARSRLVGTDRFWRPFGLLPDGRRSEGCPQLAQIRNCLHNDPELMTSVISFALSSHAMLLAIVRK
jgi:hypothetical protein